MLVHDCSCRWAARNCNIIVNPKPPLLFLALQLRKQRTRLCHCRGRHKGCTGLRMDLYAQYHTPVQVLDDGGTVVGLVQLLPLVSVGSAVPGTWENARLSGLDTPGWYGQPLHTGLSMTVRTKTRRNRRNTWNRNDMKWNMSCGCVP